MDAQDTTLPLPSEQPEGLFSDVLDSLPDNTRGKLLRAFARVVVAKGLPDSTVKDVLNEARYSRRTFYQHFSSLDDALVALFDHVAEITVRNMSTATDPRRGGSAIDKIMRVIEVYVEGQQRTGRLSLVFYIEAMRPESVLAARRGAIVEGLTALLRQRAELVVKQPVDPLLLRAMVLSVESMVMHFKRQGRFDETNRARIVAVAYAMISRTLLPHMAEQGELPEPKNARL